MTRDDPAAFAPPPAFGPFRVLHQIGIGALGPVFRTYEPTRDRLVAVKVFRLDITPEQAQALADELARAADAGLFHPSIVEPVAAGVEGTVAYRAEEYVAGESMDVAIRHYAPAALDKALPFITQLAGAIDFARAAGVGHGALHLRDIFVTPDEARASGFGVVDALDRLGLRAPVRRPYTAPERIAGQPWSTPADVFSLAAIAYELLTGRRPSGTGDQIGALASDTAGEHAAAIRAVLARAMDDDPALRYQSALGFASALEAAARGAHVTEALRDVSAIAAAAPPAAHVVTAEVIEDFPDAEVLPEPAPEALDAIGEYPDEDAAAEQELADLEAEREEEAFEEPLADLAIEPARSERFSEEFAFEPEETAAPVERQPEPPRHIEPDRPIYREPEPESDDKPIAPAYAAPVVHAREADDMRDASLAGMTHDRPRIPMLPVAVGVVLALLAGFAAGYAVGSRDRAEAPVDTAATSTAPASGASPAQPVREFSEQAVTQPGAPAAAPPPSEAPPVAAEAPAPAAAPPKPAAARSGTITIRSTPPRAGVTINGQWRGRTPLDLTGLKFGPYTVRVVEPGYAVAREEFTLSATDPDRALSFRLQRSASRPSGTRSEPTSPPRAAAPAASPERGASYSGVIYVDSRPRGATIIIDGKRVGTTPARIPDVAIGSHVVRLELADHLPWTSSTRVAAGQETRVTGSLERIQ